MCLARLLPAERRAARCHGIAHVVGIDRAAGIGGDDASERRVDAVDCPSARSAGPPAGRQDLRKILGRPGRAWPTRTVERRQQPHMTAPYLIGLTFGVPDGLEGRREVSHQLVIPAKPRRRTGRCGWREQRLMFCSTAFRASGRPEHHRIALRSATTLSSISALLMVKGGDSTIQLPTAVVRPRSRQRSNRAWRHSLGHGVYVLVRDAFDAHHKMAAAHVAHHSRSPSVPSWSQKWGPFPHVAAYPRAPGRRARRGRPRRRPDARSR